MKFLHLILLTCLCITSQITAQINVYESDLEFRGATAANGGDQTEFFEQRRTVLRGLSLDTSAKVQVGLSKTRVENIEILELPLLYRHQINEKLSVYGGVQAQLIRGIQTGGAPTFREAQATFGVEYDITPLWDAGVQFVIPLGIDNGLPKGNFELSQPIRLRTGIKF